MADFGDFEGGWYISVDNDYDGPRGFDVKLGLLPGDIVPIELRVQMARLAGVTPDGMQWELTERDGNHVLGKVSREQGGRRLVGAAHLVLGKNDEDLGGGDFFVGTVTVHDGESLESPGVAHVVLTRKSDTE